MKLIVFDVDGTLVDSQVDILGSMAASFAAQNLSPPSDDNVRGIVGLSLPQAIERLVPEASPDICAALVDGYKEVYAKRRSEAGKTKSSTFYPGVREMLAHLAGFDQVLLGVATGNSRRGLDMLLDGHGLRGMFVTEQVADHHPSKPHPSMLYQAMADCGVEAADTVMIGDTSFDMEMAAAANVTGIGVSWGYHPVQRLSSAKIVIDRIVELPGTLNQLWGKWHE